MNLNTNHFLCPNSHKIEIREGVILFVNNESYSSSFGQQWNYFSETQLDSFNGSNLTEKRFFDETGWSKDSLADAVVLDAGCGSGRFTEIAAKYARTVIAVDLSDAIFAIPKNVTNQGNVIRVHGDLRNLSLDFSKITHVFSIGVLQHTPKPYETLLNLTQSMHPGTKFAFTAYASRWYTPLHPKYLIRPITKHLPRKQLLSFLESALPKYFDFLMRLVRPLRTRKLFKFLIPVALYPEFESDLTREKLIEFTILDTFDMWTPTYDSPLKSKKTRKLLIPFSSNFEVISSVPVVVRGERV
jgi:2-polyprenyl-3-methyl-5-hydroxy-6-metoxy-1,4-benzoquinol methylase